MKACSGIMKPNWKETGGAMALMFGTIRFSPGGQPENASLLQFLLLRLQFFPILHSTACMRNYDGSANQIRY